VNENQRIDHAYHEDKLLRLIARRNELSLEDSVQALQLDTEMSRVYDLVRSYRLVTALESFNERQA
jgi:hypothetical protein